MLGKIQKAVSDMKAATTLEAAQTTFNAIEDEVVATSNRNDEKFAELVNEVKTAREEQKQLLEELFAKYKEILPTIEGTDANDMAILDTLIAQARKEANNAKTANDVKKAQTKFENLMDSELKKKVEDQTELLQAQMNANDEMDTYKDVLDAMTDLSGAERELIENQIETVKEDIKNAKDVPAVNAALSSFNTFMSGHSEVNTKAKKALLDRAVQKAVEKLETYKAGAYAESTDPAPAGSKKIKELVDDYIKQINDKAKESSTKAEDIEAKLEEILKGTDPAEDAYDGLDEKIEKIKEDLEKNYAKYVEAYNSAIEELDFYAKNAKEKLTGDELAYVNSLIESTKGKLASDTVQSADDVTGAMTVFRNAVAQYSSEFDEYQIEETRKAAVAELESYKGLNNPTINTKIEAGLTSVNAAETVNGIQSALKSALDEINKIISENKVLQAIADARAEFTKYLGSDTQYSNEVKGIVSQALKELESIDVSKATVEDVQLVAEKYNKQLTEQLTKDGQAAKVNVEARRKTAREELALYKELATLSEDSQLLKTIAIYEKNIESDDATVDSIEEALKELLTKVINNNATHELVREKLVAINKVNTINDVFRGNAETQGDSFIKKEDVTNLVTFGKETVLTDYKEIKDAVDAVINEIKNVKKSETAVQDVKDLLSKATKDTEGELPKLVSEMNTFEGYRSTALTTLAGKDEHGVSASIIGEYTDKINAVTLEQYKNGKIDENDDKVFDDLIAEAENKIKDNISGLNNKVTEAGNNAKNIGDVDTKVGTQTPLFDKKTEDLQSGVKIENGKVSGTIKKQESYAAYGDSSTDGYYVCLRFECPEASRIVLKRTGGGYSGGTHEITALDEGKKLKEDWDGTVNLIVRIKPDQVGTLRIEYEYYGWTEDGEVDTENVTKGELTDFSGLKFDGYVAE